MSSTSVFFSSFFHPNPNHACSHLTEQYGVDVASEMIDRARSTTTLLTDTTTNIVVGSPESDKYPFAFKSDSHTGQSIHRVF